MSVNDITQQVIGAALEVHRELGPGLLESAYEECLAYEFMLRNIPFQRQLTVPLKYKEIAVDVGFRLDFLVCDQVVVELKASEEMKPVYTTQVLTYLKLTGCHVALLINFNVKHLTNGIRRLVLDLEEDYFPRSPRSQVKDGQN